MLFKRQTDGPPQSFTRATARNKPPKNVARTPQPECPDQAPATSPRSTLTPGPIDELTETFLTNLPLAPDGLALRIASTNAAKFSLRSASGKLALPIPAWMIPAFSTRNSTWPDL